MRAGTAIWLAGWLFVMGAISTTELKKNPNYKMGFKETICCLVGWPLALGEEYARKNSP